MIYLHTCSHIFKCFMLNDYIMLGVMVQKDFYLKGVNLFQNLGI